MTKKTTLMRQILESESTEFIAEAHNGMSAKIVEESGFKGIWGSGLTISASLGLRDNNEASWSQVLDVIEFMSDCTSIPILLDGDTGFGNFNNMRRLVKKLEQRGAGGVCIEDKIFPKTNSFIGGEKQALANIEEFSGRIKAGKDTQTDIDFCIVARIEAFIEGWGLEEALKRAHAYVQAGADAILIHSKRAHPKEIFSFMEAWDGSAPVVIVPTMYYETPTDEFRKAGISLIIWANHLMRSAVKAMQETARRLYEEETLACIESTVVPVSEIFRIQNAREYEEAERRYLPQQRNISAAILAASKGNNFGTLTEDRPKCMIPLRGKSILERQVSTLNACGIRDISVVSGYKMEAIDLPGIRHIENREYETHSILFSYYCARDIMEGPCIISFGDILYEPHILRDLIETDGNIVLAVDTSWWQIKNDNREIDKVICTVPPSDQYLSERCTGITEIGTRIDRGAAHGEWTGLLKLSSDGAEVFRSELERFFQDDEAAFCRTDITDFFNRLIEQSVDVRAYYFRGHWLDIDGPEDLKMAAQQRSFIE